MPKIIFVWDHVRRPDLRPVKIVTRRAMRLGPVGGELDHVDAGAVITITMDDLAGLGADDYAMAPRRHRTTSRR